MAKNSLAKKTVKHKQISWKTSEKDAALISEIADRAWNLQGDAIQDRYSSKLDLVMDLTATHNNGCPLNLKELLKAPDFDFLHDTIGIHRHLNRKTGELENFFLPRFSK